MNFINFLIIILMFSFAKPQSIATAVNIKPVVEIPNKGNIRFIGFEGDGLYKKAYLYEITEKNTLKKLPQFKIELKEDNTTYLVDGHFGDVTGEGEKDLLLIFNDPNRGTTVYGWTLEKNGRFSPFKEPSLLTKQQKLSQPTSSKLVKIYPDKDKELVITFGSPDRKAVILDYINKIEQTEEIGEQFLSNLAGPILMETGDFNKDGLEDIFLLNNGEEKLSTAYLSPERSPVKTKLPFKDPILDVFYLNSSTEAEEKYFLLKGGLLYVESWNKIVPLEIEDAKNILLYKDKKLSIINNKGTIKHYEIDSKTQQIIAKNTVTPIFKEKNYSSINYLILNDLENMIITHNSNGELIYQPIYYNLKEKPEILKIPEKQPLAEAKINKKEKADKEKQIVENKPKEKQTAENKPKEKPIKKKDEEKELLKKVKSNSKKQTVFLGETDTVIVNVGEKTEIKIKLNKEYNFIDLTTEEKPETMNFDTEKLLFYWEPKEKDIGNNTLQYQITYSINKGIQKNDSNGKLVIQNKTEEVKENKNYIIYVNDPPKIIFEEEKYKVQANKKLAIPVFVEDKNAEQKIEIKHSFSKEKNARIENKEFVWTPKNKDYGTHKVVFNAFDGITSSQEKIEITVDTLMQEIVAEKTLITTVNEEFKYDLKRNGLTQFSKVKAPSNLRISKEGVVHWIPIATQLGMNKITIEAIERKEGFRINFDVYVNSPPVISYSPDQIEYVSKNEEFVFQFQSFDQNEEQNLFWSLANKPKNMELSAEAELAFIGRELDFLDYTVQLSDTIDVDVFKGSFYVNDKPKITSSPPQHINLENILEYYIEVEDNNSFNPLNRTKEKHIKTSILKGPKGMIVSNQKLLWKPEAQDIGPHKVTIIAEDGIDKAEQEFTLYVNDTPSIITADSISVKLGDTLRHVLTAKDSNKKNNLTYSIKSNLEGLTLDASSGEIIWVPKKEDLGAHVIEANVSDGFDSMKAGKKIQILVYDFPKFINSPPKEAYVDIEYKYNIEAEDAYGGIVKNKDVFVSLVNTTFVDLFFDSAKQQLFTTPVNEDIGTQTIELKLEDKEGRYINKIFEINVLMSPCETVDTLYINQNQTMQKETVNKIEDKEIKKKKKEKKKKEKKKKEKKKKEKKKKEKKERENEKETPPSQTGPEEEEGIKTRGFKIPGSRYNKTEE